MIYQQLELFEEELESELELEFEAEERFRSKRRYVEYDSDAQKQNIFLFLKPRTDFLFFHTSKKDTLLLLKPMV